MRFITDGLINLLKSVYPNVKNLSKLRAVNGLTFYSFTELEFLKSLWGLGTEEEEGYRTGPPGYRGWRNSFLGIDSGAPYTSKNTGSVYYIDSFRKSTEEVSA